MTPFSVYQGRWNAAFRDMEAEIIPMCEDQGMAIVPWAALGGGQLLSTEQRKARDTDPSARKGRELSEKDVRVCDTLEHIAESRGTTMQATVSVPLTHSLPSLCTTDKAFPKPQALSYLFQQSPYVFPIVGVNTVDHVKSMPDALRIKLTKEEISTIQDASSFDPLFPVNFLFNYKGNQPYNLGHTAAHCQQYQMAAWIDAPPKPPVSRLIQCKNFGRD